MGGDPATTTGSRCHLAGETIARGGSVTGGAGNDACVAMPDPGGKHRMGHRASGDPRTNQRSKQTEWKQWLQCNSVTVSPGWNSLRQMTHVEFSKLLPTCSL